MKNLAKYMMASCIAAAFASCSHKEAAPVATKSGLYAENFKAIVDGKPTGLYTLTNENGMEVCVTNYGGRIVSIMVPDRDGKFHDVVLGFDSIQAYLPENNHTDFGASIGRYANRIADGKITIDGTEYQLPQNNYPHCLHGGDTGWQYQVYSVEQPNDSTVKLTLVSPDGDNNFPGEVTAGVTYTLTADNAIDIAYTATTDAPTVINMTNHSYFNLNGDPSEPITDNILYVNADNYTPVDSTFMTTGEIATVEGTPMDFTEPKLIGAEIDNIDFEQIKNGKGYDHNWVLNTAGNDSIVAATLVSPKTGIRLDVLTDEPGVQVYTGNFLKGDVTGKNSQVYNKRAAICLETQHYPDSPNKPQWPSVVLRPGEEYTSHCVFKFSVEE